MPNSGIDYLLEYNVNLVKYSSQNKWCMTFLTIVFNKEGLYEYTHYIVVDYNFC